MDKTALADRFEGYSEVFASDCNMGIDLKAMADTLRSMPEEKFAKVINADFDEEAMIAPGMIGPSSTQHGGRGVGEPHRTTGGPATTSVYPEMKQDKTKMTPEISKILKALETQPGALEKFINLVSGKAVVKEATLDAEAVVSPMGGPGALGRRTPLSDRPWMKGDSKKVKMTPEISADIANALETEPALFEKAKSLVKQASTGDAWTKSASDYIAQNLVRDVLGMEKSICCDTKRHLDKKQMPDATKTQETKGAVARQEDTGAGLKPEQVPHLDEKLDSDMYKKSQGKVRKEATTEETPDAKAAEPQEVKDAGKETPEETTKRLDKIEKEKKEEELKAKSRPEAKKEAEASTIIAEGIEFDNVMMDVDANDEDVKKLSALFE